MISGGVSSEAANWTAFMKALSVSGRAFSNNVAIAWSDSLAKAARMTKTIAAMTAMMKTPQAM